MSIVFYDLSFLVIFTLAVVLFLYKRRSKLEREGILYLYRTQIGIKFINYVGGRFEKFWSKLGYVVIFSGYVMMITMVYLLIQILYIYIKQPLFVQAIKIPPIAPLIPYLPSLFKADFLPMFYFTYWIISIAIIATVHEFSHGIFARHARLKIKSTGFGFLGPLLAAFVEPDEKKMQKIDKKNQLAILCAGSFANLITAILFFFIMWLFFIGTFIPSGVIVGGYSSTQVSTADISSMGGGIGISIDGFNLTQIEVGENIYFTNLEKVNLSSEKINVFIDSPALRAELMGIITEFDGEEVKDSFDLSEKLYKRNVGDKIVVKTLLNDSREEYEITLGKNPINQSLPFLGIVLGTQASRGVLGGLRETISFFKVPGTNYLSKINWDLGVFIYNLFWWIILINISVALVNMLPVGIFDGGRVFYVTMLTVLKSERWAKKAYLAATYIIILVFVLLTVIWGVNYFK
ncbi:MAG: site-2 protease family protein [archaeon]